MPAFIDPNTIHDATSGTSPPATFGDIIRDDLMYLYERGPLVCTSSTRPTPATGMQIFETDTKKTLVYDGAAWWTIAIAGNAVSSYTPTLAQGTVIGATNITKTVTVSEYRIINGICEWWFVLTVTQAGSGNAGAAVTLTTPVTAAAADLRSIGGGSMFDASAGAAPGNYDAGVWALVTTTTIALLAAESVNLAWGATPSVELQVNDVIRGHVRFRVASAA